MQLTQRQLGWLLALALIAAGLPNLAYAQPYAQHGPWDNWGWGWGQHTAANGPWNNWGWGWEREHRDWDRDHHDQDRHDWDHDRDHRR